MESDPSGTTDHSQHLSSSFSCLRRVVTVGGQSYQQAEILK